MQWWINQVLVPKKLTKPPSVVPIFVLHVYPIDIIRTVMNGIQPLGNEMFHIPVRFMYLCPPVDMGRNTMIKSRVQGKWEG